MPSITNLTISKVTGSDVFTAVQGAGPDGTLALWQFQSTLVTRDQYCYFTLLSRFNADRTARKVQAAFRSPILRDTAVSGVQEIIGFCDSRIETTIPLFAGSSMVADHHKRLASFVGDSNIQTALNTGYAPN